MSRHSGSPSGDRTSTVPQRQISTAGMMGRVILALVPAIVLCIWYGDTALLWQLAIACPLALALEAIVLRVCQRDIRLHLTDGSALLTAVLFCLLIPATTPWLLLLAGVSVAILLGKHAFGGLGNNLFDPALLAYLVLLLCFPAAMLHGQSSWAGGVDLPARADLVISLALLAGGLFLMSHGIIRWHLPLAYLIALAVMLFLFDLPLSVTTIMLAAFFIITDPVTSPVTPAARVWYGSLAGILTGALGLWLHPPTAAAVAILVMNMAVPLLDYVLRHTKNPFNSKPEDPIP